MTCCGLRPLPIFPKFAGLNRTSEPFCAVYPATLRTLPLPSRFGRRMPILSIGKDRENDAHAGERTNF